MQTTIFKHEGHDIKTVMCKEQVWFRANDVASILGYSNERQAIRINVDEEDRSKLEDLMGLSDSRVDRRELIATYVNESGLYSLILRSQKTEAKVFKRWVTSEVLPSIRRAGLMRSHGLNSETALHYKVIDFIRHHYPDALLAPGLGELQDTSHKRIDAYKKGYLAGTPDILILNHHKRYSGFAIELKNPNGKGVLSDKQQSCLQKYRQANFKTLVSCDSLEIIKEIVEYMQHLRICCPYCDNKLKSTTTLETHLRCFHKILNNCRHDESSSED